MKKIKLVGIFFLNLFAISAYNQVNFRPGFIITNNRDTIRGKIDYRSDYQMSKVCTFKSEKFGKKKYSPGDILGYRFEKDRFFETANIDGKSKFLEILVQGELTIYYYMDETRYHYFFKKRNGELKELDFFERTVYLDKDVKDNDGNKYEIVGNSSYQSKVGLFTINSQEFKKILLDSLKDEPELSSEINNLNKPDHIGLMNLAKKYHELKNNNREFIVYRNLYIRSDYNFSIGWVSINYGKIPSDEKYLLYSFKGYVPLSDGKLYLGYGIQYASMTLPYYSYKIFRIPLSVRYQYPGNILKPHAAMGLNVYCINGGVKYQFIRDFIPSYNIGLAVKVYKSIYLTLDLEGDLCWDSYYNSSTTAPFSKTNYVGLMISL